MPPLGTSSAPTPPPHLAEGTEVLDPGRVSINVGGGATSFETQCCGAKTANEVAVGFEGRLRTGLRYNQEVGLSAMLGGGTNVGGGDPPFGGGGKLSYKIAPLPWLA